MAVVGAATPPAPSADPPLASFLVSPIPMSSHVFFLQVPIVISFVSVDANFITTTIEGETPSLIVWLVQIAVYIYGSVHGIINLYHYKRLWLALAGN